MANPADTGGAYLSNLQELVKVYPQSGLFRALYGRALNETTPLVAGAYFDSRALHKLLHHQENIAPISNDQVVIQSDGKLFGGQFTEAADEPGFVSEAQIAAVEANLTDTPTDFPDVLKTDWPVSEAAVTEAEPEQEAAPPTDFAEPVEVSLTETLPEDKPEEVQAADEVIAQPFVPAPWEAAQTDAAPEPVEEEEPLGRAPWELDDDEEETPVVAAAPEPAFFEPVAAVEEPAAEPAPEPVQNTADDDERARKLAYWASLEDEYDLPQADSPKQPEAEQNYIQPETPINEDVYDEITSIEDIGLEQINTAPAGAEQAKPEQDEADRLIMGSIASADFFRFDKAFGDASNRTATPGPEQQAAPESAPPPMYRPHPQSAPPAVQQQQEPVHQDVSKYHDEKMPYTFMWWLDKTRREHGSLYQPYAKVPVNRPAAEPPRKTRPDELQQQYFENIFHLSSAEDFVPDAAQTIEFDMQSKEDRIIKRFITEDPHIHPPVGEKLDTENKAKKSSEDAYEMVTETLARIYADQMLFPKAIATYKKLMLKYPEKSRYFASRIENLEKRTN